MENGFHLVRVAEGESTVRARCETCGYKGPCYAVPSIHPSLSSPSARAAVDAAQHRAKSAINFEVGA